MVRVLVVDDNIDQTVMLSNALRHVGYSVKCANTGPDGLKLALQWQPDIVLLDIDLPGLDGYEVARRLRAAEKLRDGADVQAAGAPIRLIALTGYGSEADVALALGAGFDSHMVKPCDVVELVRLLSLPAP